MAYPFPQGTLSIVEATNWIARRRDDEWTIWPVLQQAAWARDMRVADDIEELSPYLDNVSTPERREDLSRWFYDVFVPALAQDAKLRLAGTMLHEESLIGRAARSPLGSISSCRPRILMPRAPEPPPGRRSSRCISHCAGVPRKSFPCRHRRRPA
jgi:hypothetical protein